jgi:hypothetical protein
VSRIALVAGMLLTAGCGGPYRLSQPGERVDLGVYSVDPQSRWNISANRIWQEWTIDGFVLEEVSFVNGLPDGQALYPRLQRRENAPQFRSSMSPPQVAEFLKSSLELLMGARKFKMSEPKPQPFGSREGTRIDIEFANTADLDQRGLIVWTIHGGRLYLIFYRAAKEYYFPKYRDVVERLIASIR